MTIKPIKNSKDYQHALNRLEMIFDSKKGSSEGDELEILGMLIEKRKLSLDMIRQLHKVLKIPTEVLIQPY